MTTCELLGGSAPHEGGQLTPDFIVEHEGPVFCLWGGVGKPQGAPTAGYDAQLLYLINALSAAECPCCCLLPWTEMSRPGKAACSTANGVLV